MIEPDHDREAIYASDLEDDDLLLMLAVVDCYDADHDRYKVKASAIAERLGITVDEAVERMAGLRLSGILERYEKRSWRVHCDRLPKTQAPDAPAKFRTPKPRRVTVDVIVRTNSKPRTGPAQLELPLWKRWRGLRRNG